MRPSTKNIDFNYKQTLVSNRVNLIPNDCFGNILTKRGESNSILQDFWYKSTYIKKKLLNSDYPIIENLIGHRYYSLDFIKAQNHFSYKGSLFATAYDPQSQGCVTFNSKKELIIAYLGLFEYKLKTWVKPSF